MTSENITKERWDQLGLPPMELAESSENSRNNNGVYKCLLPKLQKLIVMILLTVFGVGTYVLLLKVSENYDNVRSTEIIKITADTERANVTVINMELIMQIKNATAEHKMKRKKRHAMSSTNMDDSIINLSDEQLQKAREIILKHDVLCNNEDKQDICKDFVTKLKSLTENSDVTKTKEDLSRKKLKENNNDTDVDNKTSQNDIIPTDISKREVLPIMNLDSIIESVPNFPLQIRDANPLNNLNALPHPHSVSPSHLPDTCLLARLLKMNYPGAKEIYDPTSEYLASNYEHPLMHQSRYFPPALHTPYPQARDIDGQRRKIHPQDIDIFMSLLTSKAESPATKRSSNTSRETTCPSGTVPCLNGDACVDEKQWCDGNVDCVDVSDEAGCTCKSRVDKSRLCDGYFDCPFGEDEMGCFGCDDNMFSCEDLDTNSQSSCFSKEQRCNNVVDCRNHKDEVECNMLAPSLLKKPLFAISNTEGFLHRNFKGEWYAVCKNPYMWAHDACRRETGLIIRPPFMQIVPIDPTLKIDYLNTGPGGLLQTSDTCMNSSAVYVTCPDMLCGTRVQSTSQLLRQNAAIENHLFGRNKRFLLTKRPYPVMYYGNRVKRNVDYDTNQNIKFDALKRHLFDTMRNRRESRVVGGKPSQPAAWPWMVAVYRNGMFHCGGVVITHNWIVSAAHCVHKFWDHYYEVQVGMLRRFSFSPQEQSHKVTHVIVNSHYSQTDMKNDLSLLKVEPAIQFSRWVRPICLPSPDTAGPDWLWGPAPGTICTAVGWGATKEHGPDPDHMREVEVPIWENCKHREDRAGKEICAGLSEGGKDACQGDSGGPLLCRNPLNSQQWYMAGIVSHGDGCARKDEPGVYTRVSLFVKWIKYHISSKSLPIVQPIQECPGFKCKSGISKCLPNKRKCDRIVDCLDGEDETKCEFTRTVSTLSDNIFLHQKSSLEESFETKETHTKSSLMSSDEESEEFTTQSRAFLEISSTLQPKNEEVITSTDKIVKGDSKNENLDFNTQTEENSFQSKESSHNEDLDFEHASPLEMTHSKSSEDLSASEENVTSDPSSMSNTESSIQSHGDAEIMTVEFSGESLESKSSVLELIKETTTQTLPTKENINNGKTNNNNILETITEPSTTEFIITGDEKTEEPTTSLNVFESLTESSLETSTIENGDHTNQMKITDLIVELMPNPHSTVSDSKTNITLNNNDEETSTKKNSAFEDKSEMINKIGFGSDQEGAETKLIDNETNITLNNNQEEKSIKKNPDFEDKSEIMSKIENIVFSELEPAKLRRKHRVPREFDCRRIDQKIPYHHRCDRKADCEDGTDELDCTCTDYLSSFDEKLICDGVFDCADGQDEADCFGCPENHFLCKRSQICLPEKHVCDGKPECPHGEDELDCFALTNGKEMEFDLDERPVVNLEGYLTKKHFNDWHIVCDEKLSLEQQEQAATRVCRYLGFSSANRYNVKYINLKEDEIAERSLDSKRNRRETLERVPIHFAYRQENENDTVQHVVLKEPQVIKEQCVPNITKTCKSLYVFCDHSLFTDFDNSGNVFLRGSETVSDHMWPWIAKVFIEGDYRCSGVLVNLSWVLVSDSCLWDSTLAHHYITVVLGSHRTLGSVSGMHEQVYQVDAKKDIYRSKASLLHLKEPAQYSNVVKPMAVSNSIRLQHGCCNRIQKEPPHKTGYNSVTQSKCVAIGQDYKNNTISVFLEETNENCHPSNRCYKRKASDNLCPLDVKSHRHWAGIVSCHTDQGWYPAATFVDDRGECGLGDHINGTDIENLRNEIKHHYGKKTLPSLVDDDYGDDCEGVRCGRGRCLRLVQVCDGVRDCEDGNDESEHACDKKRSLCDMDPYHAGCECSAGQMKCRNGKCVSKELFRDGHNDCGDSTDEPGQTTCSDYLARVMPSRLCDGILHCHDRSDEDPMFCKCFAKKTYKCGTKSGIDHCVAPDMVCDGVRDCPNGEDEQTCIGLNAPQGTPYGTGQVIVRSHGIWHSKCYASENHTKSELESICSELGYKSGHAKQIKELENFVVHPYNNLIIDPFNEITLNNNTVIKMRNTHEPIAKAVLDKELQNCYPVFIECR